MDPRPPALNILALKHAGFQYGLFLHGMVETAYMHAS